MLTEWPLVVCFHWVTRPITQGSLHCPITGIVWWSLSTWGLSRLVLVCFPCINQFIIMKLNEPANCWNCAAYRIWLCPLPKAECLPEKKTLPAESWNIVLPEASSRTRNSASSSVEVTGWLCAGAVGLLDAGFAACLEGDAEEEDEDAPVITTPPYSWAFGKSVRVKLKKSKAFRDMCVKKLRS